MFSILFSILIFMATCFFLVYKMCMKHYDYFNGLGIKFDIPSMFEDTVGRIFFNRLSMIDRTRKYYNKFSQEKIYAILTFSIPTICVRDLKLIKKMFITDFDYFTARRTTPASDDAPFLSLNVSSLYGKEHRAMRSTLSGLFSSSKTKQMFELISTCADVMIQHIINQNEFKTTDISVFDAYKLFSAYGVDTMSSSTFGIETNSYKNPNNKFYKYVYEIVSTPWFKLILITLVPNLANFFNIKFEEKESDDYFRSLIFDTIKVRKKENIYRPDIINLIMQLRNGTLKYDTNTKPIEGFATVDNYSNPLNSKNNWSDDQLLAQCLLFVTTGSSAFAATLAFTVIELAIHEEIQDRLYQEIIDTDRELQGNPINYETIVSMKYLDMVVSEVLRKWPSSSSLSRVCTKEYLLEIDHLRTVLIKKGTNFEIPVTGLHFDPKYFPNPNEFDPERFSNERIHTIISGTYLPFGFGPRNCLGSRFSLLVLKRGLFSLMKQFSFETCSMTKLPLKSGTYSTFSDMKMFIGFRKRI